MSIFLCFFSHYICYHSSFALILGRRDNIKLSLLYRVTQKQMAFMLGRHGMFLELNEDVEDYEDLTEIMSNVQLNSNFLALAREVRKTRETQPCGFQKCFFILLIICPQLIFNYWNVEEG